MIYLLDTNILIYMLRGLKSSKRPAQRRHAQILFERCRETQISGDAVGLSAITVSELEFGAQDSGQYEAEIAAVNKVLMPFDVYDFDATLCPLHFGRIRHGLESLGVAIGAMDILIAAHAFALGATLVSNDIAHFSRIAGLHTVTWLSNS